MKQAAILLIALALSSPALAQPSAPTGTPRQNPVAGGAKLSASLTGAAEVPPGPRDATGSFAATLNPGHDQLCYELTSRNLEAPTAAHIHQGVTGQNGGPVVMLEPPKSGMSRACVAVANDLAMKLMQHPENYYVNVHNAAYPNGGLRGQLTKQPQ